MENKSLKRLVLRKSRIFLAGDGRKQGMIIPVMWSDAGKQMEEYTARLRYMHICSIYIPKVLKSKFHCAEGIDAEEIYYLCTLRRVEKRMKAKEIEWKEISVLPLCANVFPPGKPYKAQMMLGKAFPISKAQAMEFVRMGCNMAEMNSEDVCIIERLLGKYHMTGEYRYVGDKRHVKLINQMDLDKALKLEYDF